MRGVLRCTSSGKPCLGENGNMKTKNLLIAVAVGLAVSAAYQLRADDSLLPPRAKQLFERKTVARSADVNGPNLVHVGPMGPAAKNPTTRENKISGVATSGPNLLERPLYTGKNPFRELRRERFELAPLRKGKQCEAGCTKPCCATK